MVYRELYLEPAPLRFPGRKAGGGGGYTVIGVPFDSTSSYKPGSRFAPLHIREAAQNIESNSLLGIDMFIEEVPVEDAGDLAVVHGDPATTLDRLSKVVEEVANSGSIPVVLGGEHTITAGVLEGLHRAGLRPCMLVFDAHLDLRDEYLGLRLGHASAIRRAVEIVRPMVLAYVGVRAFDREEIEYARSMEWIHIVTPQELARLGPRNVATRLRRLLAPCETVYLSLDIDAIDPSYAPGTGTPEPLGITPFDAFRILGDIVDGRFAGMDLVEVNPLVDVNGVTSILAARLLQEFMLVRESRAGKR